MEREAKMRNDDVSSSNANGVNVDELITVCPSFNTYYSDRQAAAARAVNEVLAERSSRQQSRSELDEDEFGFATGTLADEEDEDDDGFEFSILCNESNFQGGEIFPIFDRDLIGEAAKVDSASVSLKKLFLDEERGDESESEEEDRELESVEPGTYCVWKPKTTSSSSSNTPTLSPKSKSTGSGSKRWKLRDLLLRRSNSDGKDSFVYLTTTAATTTASISANSEKVKSERRRGSGEYNNRNSNSNRKSAHEVFYAEKRAVKEEDKRRSYLPYRKGLVGFGLFPNGMGVTNNFRPF